MLQNQTAEYALRAVSCMAVMPPDEPVRTRDLRGITAIPAHYLSKVMRLLVRAGILLSQKGHGGGFMLAKEPRLIRFLDVLDAVGYRFDPERCGFGRGSCNTDEPCPLHGPWNELAETIHEWASTTTLADIRDGGTIPSWLREPEDEQPE